MASQQQQEQQACEDQESNTHDEKDGEKEASSMPLKWARARLLLDGDLDDFIFVLDLRDLHLLGDGLDHRHMHLPTASRKDSKELRKICSLKSAGRRQPKGCSDSQLGT